ncbi:MAG: hypothetical protein QMD17_02970 [Rhodocyclaceae bacterium]|nr:hypothetical protein [Rhodocyclaceae bacterium]
MVQKEIAVHLLAYNLVRAVMAQAAFLGHVLPRHILKAALVEQQHALHANDLR